MKGAWKVFRAVMSVLLLLAVLLPVSLYVLLSLTPIQKTLCHIAATELSQTLGADVAIGRVDIHPFNRLSVEQLSLSTGADTIARINTVSAGFELYHFIRTGELVIDYALIDGVSLNLWRDSIGSQINIAPIISHLKSDKPKREHAFDLKLNTVILRHGALNYDVLSEALPNPEIFCKNHIKVENIALNAFIPQISNECYQTHIDHLSFTERSGFTLSAMQAKVEISPRALHVDDLIIELPSSIIAFAPLSLNYNGFSGIRSALDNSQTRLATAGNCKLFPPDFKAFFPPAGAIDHIIGINLDVEGSMSHAVLHRLSLTDISEDIFKLEASGAASYIGNNEKFAYEIDNCDIRINGTQATDMLGMQSKNKKLKVLSNIAALTCRARAKGDMHSGSASINASGTAGELEADAAYRRTQGRYIAFSADIRTSELDLGLLLETDKLTRLTAEAETSGTFNYGKISELNFTTKVQNIGFKGYDYTGINADAKFNVHKGLEANISIDDPNVHLLAYGLYEDRGKQHHINATATASGVDFAALGLDKTRAGYRFGAKLNISAEGKDIDDIEGSVQLFDIRWLDKLGNGLKIEKFTAQSYPEANPPKITVDSDIINGSVSGPYAFSSIAGQMYDMAASFLPALFDDKRQGNIKAKQPNKKRDKANDFNYSFTISPTENITKFLGSPIHVLDNASINGHVNSAKGTASLAIDAPYLSQGSKLLENTVLYLSLDTAANLSSVYATTQFQTKKGEMALSALINAADNRIDTRADWSIERAIPIGGTLGFSTLLRSRPNKNMPGTFPVDAHIDFEPGTINFGDETWSIKSSAIDISPSRLDVNGFCLDAGNQRITIEGSVGADPDESLAIKLDNMALLPIFETLEIDKALIGGRASGTFTAQGLLGAEPSVECPKLHVDSIGYQYCTIGNADVAAKWDNAKRAVCLDAAVTGFEGKHSRINGDIYPFDEALDLNFYADSIPVGFLKPFMSAFTSSINGRASGHCRLFGTFKQIDLEGDVKADDVSLKIDFTGTSYSATDSVHMRPGKIELCDISIRDVEGHTAKLNGIVGHTFFKEPTFRFDISHAQDFLSYNINSRQNPDWYGTIYGNGGASISGYPGTVNINVAMSTAPRSTFTFVMTDRLDAEDYSFVTFRDVTPDSLKVKTEIADDTPDAVRAFKKQVMAEDGGSSDYNMDIRVDVTKDATLTLVMDPAAGDRIQAHGDGNLHLAYRSANSDLNIWGKYAVTEGSYRFTLQDIIIKDFIIKNGSEIQFDGDPYAVKTKLNAYYATNANLSDLDESFLQDKEVARTNVPVHAIMNVSGDIRQPAIAFDLEFPTLTQDTYRKVRSIVSTDDMMNRQIIYLLALNRVYTPDYMASTTKGNELFSVASSTISSQLGNMLGKLSENWSIAPNLRSDRGDFSDVEVDVALSSRLLNNRLIFNGNFGYRDKSLNSNQFIGDFDIEYLLNKRGSWRLKAYNRYNDRNYYIRSAQTTQGVGIMFRRDFDSFGSFLRKLKKKNK